MTDSRTDGDVLSRGFRSRLWALGLLVIGALGAALWTGTRERGIGEPEDRQRLMVVTRGGNIDYYAVLEAGGFVVEVDSYANWQAAARASLDEGEGDDASEEVAQLLELADLRGFGFVVFEAPGELALGGLELEPALDELGELGSHEYAVLSVGDLAFPHRLSLDVPGDDPLLRMPGYGALEALFAQPAVLAREDPERPTVEELQHEDAIEIARWMVERPATFATALDHTRETLAASLAVDAEARALVELLETGSAVPTPDGGLLIVHHGLEIYSDDAQTLELHGDAHMRLDWLGPAGLERLLETGELALEPCPSLAGGALDLSYAPRLEAAVDGSAIAIASGDTSDDASGDTSATIWRMRDAAGCAWAEIGEIPVGVGAPGVLAPSLVREGTQRSIAAQLRVDEARRSTVRLWTQAEPHAAGVVSERDFARAEGQDAASDDGRLQFVDLVHLPDTKLAGLAFIDDEHLALLSRVPLPQDQRTVTLRADHAIHVLDRRRPGTHLRIPSQLFADGQALRELAVVEPAERAPVDPELDEPAWSRGPRLAVIVQTPEHSELLSLTIGGAAWTEYERAVLDANEDSEGGATLLSLTPEDLEVSSLARSELLANLSASRSGTLAYVSSDGPEPAEIMAVSSSGETIALTSNELVDTLPRVSADGQHVVFVTMMRTPLSTRPFSVPRVSRSRG